MNSISARLLLASAIVLASFFLLSALSLKHSVHSQAKQAQRDRMKGLVYGVLGAADLDDHGNIQINDFSLPDLRLLQPNSGMGAIIFDNQNKQVWQSESASDVLHNTQAVVVGQWRFHQLEQNQKVEEFSLRFGFSWIDKEKIEKEFNILLMADATEHYQQLGVFDRNLWVSLLSSALLLLLLQLYVLMWGLKPLSKISRGLKQIQDGENRSLDTRLPIELRPIANSLNALLISEHNRRTRYKNVMDDLAHSLKTPLSVILNLAADKGIKLNHRITLGEQSRRMKDIIAYHIRRASISGDQPLGKSIVVDPIIERLSYSLKKVYAQRDIEINSYLGTACRLRVDEADLMEIFGNLLENACKYGATMIQIESYTHEKQKQFIITIDDNGPGFPKQVNEELLERGKRADTRVDGEGLGLAVSSELLASYGGKLRLSSSKKLAGARITLFFPQAISF